MNIRTEYWSQKLGFPVKEKEDIPTIPSEGTSNPLVAQYLRDKEGN